MPVKVEPGTSRWAVTWQPSILRNACARPSISTQVVDFMVAAMAAGDFYIICPDNDVTRDVDNRRILWAAEDIIRNRPALSRWHPDYEVEFAQFLTLASPFRR
jgi:hypothetical protein